MCTGRESSALSLHSVSEATKAVIYSVSSRADELFMGTVV